MTASEPSANGRPVRDGSAEAAAVPDARERIGWLRGIGSGLVIVAVGFVLVVLVPNIVLTGSIPKSRDARGLVALGLVVVLVSALAFVLRRLQARDVI